MSKSFRNEARPTALAAQPEQAPANGLEFVVSFGEFARFENLGGLVGVVDDVVVVERTGIVSVVVIETSVSVGNNLVALVSLLSVEQLLQSDDSGQQQSQLADDQSLEGDQGQESDGEGQQSGGLQLEQQEQGQEQLLGLLLATGCSATTTSQVRKFGIISVARSKFLTLLERTLHVLDGVLGDLELDGVRSQEAGHTVNQERVNLSLTGLGLSGQDNLVQ